MSIVRQVYLLLLKKYCKSYENTVHKNVLKHIVHEFKKGNKWRTDLVIVVGDTRDAIKTDSRKKSINMQS